jgi:hypothetical protein
MPTTEKPLYSEIYKDNVINIYKDPDPKFISTIGIILLNEKMAGSIPCIVNSFISNPLFSPLRETIVSDPYYIYCNIFYNAEKNHLTTTALKDYIECGLVYHMRSFFDNRINTDLKKNNSHNQSDNLLDSFDDYYWAKNVLANDVKRLDDCINQRVYGYEIANIKNDKVTNSCYGFFCNNFSDLIEEAKELIDKLAD